MKWLKDNWPLVVVIIIAVAVAVIAILNQIDKTAYRSDLKAKDKLIEQMMVEYQTLADSVTVVTQRLEIYESAVISYQDSLNDSKIDYFTQKRRYAKAIADLNRIPTDSLYVDVTEWLNGLSLQW